MEDMTTRVRGFIDNSGLLIAGAVTALLWVNTARESYERFAHALEFVVNDIGMAFFFALAAKEVIEATAAGGALHSPRRSAVPLIAAVGGMAGPALIYLAIVFAIDEPALARGWAIPCATDIAFSYLAARIIFGARHPGIPFLLLLAIADDALGLLILAVFYPTGALRPLDFMLLLSAALAMAWYLRKRGTTSFWPYILGAGFLSWLAFYRGGLHPALALVPVLPFLPHAPRDPGLFVDSKSVSDALNEFEHWWKLPVQIILGFFSLVNAGVEFSNVGVGTWTVLGAILLGKPIGIVAATAVGVALGLQRPSGVTWRDLTVLGMIAGIGFTVALFFATAAFPDGPLLEQAKMGALLSVSAALLAAAGAFVMRCGRWAARRT
jgi:NhaA family Na+:H+ antiporter